MKLSLLLSRFRMTSNYDKETSKFLCDGSPFKSVLCTDLYTIISKVLSSTILQVTGWDKAMPMLLSWFEAMNPVLHG